MKEPSALVAVSRANSPFLTKAFLLSPADITLISTPERGGETDPSMYNPVRPVNGAILD